MTCCERIFPKYEQHGRRAIDDFIEEKTIYASDVGTLYPQKKANTVYLKDTPILGAQYSQRKDAARCLP